MPLDRERMEQWLANMYHEPIERIAKRNGVTVEEAQARIERDRKELVDKLLGEFGEIEVKDAD
jgi:hypothetical protein